MDWLARHRNQHAQQAAQELHATISALTPWQPSIDDGDTHIGEVVLHRNGDSLDIWLRIDDELTWIGMDIHEVAAFAFGGGTVKHRTHLVLPAVRGLAEQEDLD